MVNAVDFLSEFLNIGLNHFTGVPDSTLKEWITLLENNQDEDIICSSKIVLGDGIIENINNIIYIDIDTFDRSLTRAIAKEIEVINRQMGDDPYLLIGPGRWGTADPWLGIPVNWKQISNAKVIVELAIDDLSPEPSFGSHFFQNVTSLRIGYFTLKNINKGGNLDLDWIKSQKVRQATKHIRWIQLDKALNVRIDGSSGAGVILKPKNHFKDIMDEEQSSGI